MESGINVPFNITGNFDQKLDESIRKAPQASKAIDDLERKINKFKTSSKYAAAGVNEFSNSFTSLGGRGIPVATRALEMMDTTMGKVGARAGNLAKGIGAIGGRTNRAALQNTAWQLQDIIVQMEMGVEPSRIMAQQLPQIAGGFGAMGAGIGVVIGLAAALTPMVLKMSGLMNDLEGDLKDTAKALEALDTIEKLYSNTIRDQGEAFDYASSAARRFFEERESLAQIAVQENARELLTNLTKPEIETSSAGIDQVEGESFVRRVIRLGTVGASGGLDPSATTRETGRITLAESGQGMSDDQQVQAAGILLEMASKELLTREDIATAYLEAEKSLREMGLTQTQINSVTGDMVKELGIAEEIARQVTENFDVMTTGMGAFKGAWEKVKEVASEYIEDQQEANEDRASMYGKIKQKTMERFEAEEKATQAIASANALAEASVRHGKESYVYKRLQAEAELEQLETRLRASGLEEGTVQSLVAQAKSTQEILGNVGPYASLMALVERQAWSVQDAFSKTSLAHLIGQVSSLSQSLPGLANSLYGTLMSAAVKTPEGLSWKNKKDYEDRDKDAPVLGGRGNTAPDQTDIQLAGLGGVTAAPYKEPKGTGGKTAKTIAEQMADFWKEQEQVIEQTERMIGVYGQQREVLERRSDLEEELFEIKGKLSENDKTRIADLAQQLILLEERDAKEQQLYGTVESSTEDFLNSSIQNIESIEDAFKDMLGSILMEIWKQEVSKPIASGIADWLFNADGNAFSSSGVTPFAKGGVVSSPTMFSYGGGKTGVMGEAGDEAVMPLKRGKDGKLGVASSGGGGGTVVNQYYNFNALGDESVQRIIDKNIPRISQAGAQQVIAMRKSGKLRGVF